MNNKTNIVGEFKLFKAIYKVFNWVEKEWFCNLWTMHSCLLTQKGRGVKSKVHLKWGLWECCGKYQKISNKEANSQLKTWDRVNLLLILKKICGKGKKREWCGEGQKRKRYWCWKPLRVSNSGVKIGFVWGFHMPWPLGLCVVCNIKD